MSVIKRIPAKRSEPKKLRCFDQEIVWVPALSWWQVRAYKKSVRFRESAYEWVKLDIRKWIAPECYAVMRDGRGDPELVDMLEALAWLAK